VARCGACGRTWPDDVERCPDDGAPLSAELPAEQAEARAAGIGAGAPVVRLAGPRPALPEDDELAAGTVVGEYRVECLLGEGGMGAVYGAVHPIIGKRAAIKVIHQAVARSPEVVTRFVQEARAVNQIGHLNIVDVFSFGVLPDGRTYFVMEWLEGESLGRRLSRDRLGPSEAIEILDDVCRALMAAHDKGIIHRDLKPDNVFLVTVPGERPLVKLLDFGIAKLVSRLDQRAEQTRTGSMLGTPLYISPEQARGRNVDHRTDIYALGAMAFEMLCGRHPFVAESAVEILSMHLDKPPPAPSSFWPEIPEGLEQLLLAMLAKEPDGRPAMAEVRLGLSVAHQQLAADAGAVGGPASPATSGAFTRPRLVPTAEVYPPSRRPTATVSQPRGRRAVVALVVALALGGGAFAAWQWRAGTGPFAAARDAGLAPSLAPAAAAEVAAAAESRPAPAAGGPVAAAAPSTPKPAPVPPAAAGMLVVRVDVPNATVTVDGVTVARATEVVRVPVKRAGEHVVVAAAPGRPTQTRKVVVATGAEVEVTLHLAPAAAGKRKPGARQGATADRPATPGEPGKATGPTGAPKAPSKPPRRDDDDGVMDPFKRSGR
jgi:eukaryotic-like serine/threonine-protein kinase